MNDDAMIDAATRLADNAHKIALAITPVGVAGTHDATGGYVLSLTEAVMGMTAGLVRIAEAIGDLAEAVREHDA